MSERLDRDVIQAAHHEVGLGRVQAGRIVQIGTPASLFDRPVSRFAAAFMGSTNIISGTLAGLQASTAVISAVGSALALIASISVLLP